MELTLLSSRDNLDAPIVVSPPIRKAKADERFLLFLRRVELPITERKIIQFYQDYIQRVDGKDALGWKGPEGNKVWGWEQRKYTPDEIKAYALAWFDRSLGRAIRKALIPEFSRMLLEPLKQPSALSEIKRMETEQ